nr:uncharacterized protein LOC106835811 [Equus asinus]
MPLVSLQHLGHRSQLDLPDANIWIPGELPGPVAEGTSIESPALQTPGQHTDPEDDGGVQDSLYCRLSRDVPPTVEHPLLRACLKDYFWKCAMDVGQSESCWTQSSSAVFCFQGLAVSSLADTPSQHTDPEDDGGVQDSLYCR